MKYTKELLEEAVQKSISVAGVMRFLKIKVTGGNHSHISRKIKSFNIDASHFLGQTWSKGKILDNRRLKPKEILIDNKPRRDGVRLRRALIESGIEYKCLICDIKEWNGKEIVFHVDHINGDWTNSKIDNLRFLCPNCHSQTETFGSKNIRSEPKIKIPKPKKPRKTKIVWPSKEELEKLVWEKPISTLCKELGVSDNAVIQHCKKFDINRPPIGYWLKSRPEYANV